MGEQAMPTTLNHPVSANKVIPQLALPISVVALRAEAYSPDDRTVLISLTTKYSSVERTYAVPLDCFYDLVVDLEKLGALKDAV